MSKFTQLIQDGPFCFERSGGSAAHGESVDFTLSVDVGDNLKANNSSAFFTICELPIAESIPEPDSTSGFLALLGILGLSLALKHKNKMNDG